MVSISIQNISSPVEITSGSPFIISWDTVYSGFKWWRSSKIFSRIRWGTNLLEKISYVKCRGKVRITMTIPGISEPTQFIITVGYSD